MLNRRKWKKEIERWIAEDLHEGDVTAVLFADQAQETAWMQAKADGVIAGLPLLEMVYAELDRDVQVHQVVQDGALVQKGTLIAELRGRVTSLLAGERLALNLLQRLSGIATLTRRYCEKVQDLPVRIVDTRKTTPGLRGLEKYAVRIGGGHNHRFGLYDAAMLKDNHIKAAGSLTRAVEILRQELPHTVKIEVEVETMEQVEEALQVKADIIMLDNMSIEMMKQAVKRINRQAIVEASGGVTLDTVRGIAETGVDVISVGALTHSYQALDISMDVRERKGVQT
jgi:nicotinate-nucleotide pyrophosphorylase (carboxylating)